MAIEEKGTTVFVSGEAGSGKTRLVTEFLDSSKQKRDITELTGWCLSNSGVPYFPFIEAFKVYPSSAPLKDEEMGLKVWLMGPRKSDKSPELENLSPQAWKDSTFAAVTQFLFSISAKKPTILFIDDLQWADTTSLALLQYISRFILSERVLVVGTFRSEDLNPDDAGRPHPLVEALRLMGREDLFKEIKLPSLSRSDVSFLAENMVGGHVQSELAEKLASESLGNPLFIIESLKMLSEKGSLVQENNRWRLSTDEVGIPTKIKDIILRRVDALKPNQRKMLDIASVIGAKFNPELLGAVLDRESLEVLETLSTVEKSSSLVVCEGSNYRFNHAKFRDVLYEEVSPLLRKAYHGRIAESLESGWNRDGKLPVGDLAFHYAQAGNKNKAVRYALAAGEEALAIFNGTDAIKNFRYVLDATAEDTAYADARVIALEGLGDGLITRGRSSEAMDVFEQLNCNAASDLTKMRTMRKAIHASLLLGNYSHALDLANKAVQNPELDRLEYARMRLFKAIVEAWGARFKESLGDMEESLRVLEEEYSLPDMSQLLTEMGPPYISVGQHEKGIAAAIRAVALSEYSNSLDRGRFTNLYLAITFGLCGLEKESLKGVSELFKVAEKISDPVSRANYLGKCYFLSSQLLEIKAAQRLYSGLPLESMRSFGAGAKIKFFISSLISGSLGEFKKGLKAAIAQSLKGLQSVEKSDSYVDQIYLHGNLTRQYAALGDKEQAEKHYKILEKITEEAPKAGGFPGWGQYMLSKAAYFSAMGQWKEANQSYEEALELNTKVGVEQNASFAGLRQSYCGALLQQGRFADAKMQFEKAKETLDGLEKRFVHSNILGYFMAPKRIELIKEFNMRLDLVNVAKNSGVLVRAEGLVPVEFKVTAMQPKYSLKNGAVELEKKTINPFTDEAITFTVQATKPGDFILNPRLIYVDDLGETKTCKIDPVSITVQSLSR